MYNTLGEVSLMWNSNEVFGTLRLRTPLSLVG